MPKDALDTVSPTSAVSTGPLPASRKVHLPGRLFPDVAVAMREITLSAADEPAVRVYDSSGPYTDPAAAIDIGKGWLLHCGDAYFNKGEMAEHASCPAGLAAFQRTIAFDNVARLRNQRRLRELRHEHGELRLFSAHDPDELEAFINGA